MKKLNSKKDLELLMDFRQTFFEMWIKYCRNKGFEYEVS